MTLSIRPFQPADQTAAKELILAGMGERWGSIDYSMNPDLNDIQQSYIEAGHLFFVGELGGAIVGTGCLKLIDDDTGEIVRMSVSSKCRGMGFGRTLTNHLIEVAKKHQLHTILTETEYNWTSAISLYKSCGFIETHRHETEQHFKLDLTI